MITTGYLNGPQSASNAQAVTFDETAASLDLGRASVILTQDYWPVGYTGARRETFEDQGMPFVCRSGRALILPRAEAAALVALGAAAWH